MSSRSRKCSQVVAQKTSALTVTTSSQWDSHLNLLDWVSLAAHPFQPLARFKLRLSEDRAGEWNFFSTIFGMFRAGGFWLGGFRVKRRERLMPLGVHRTVSGKINTYPSPLKSRGSSSRLDSEDLTHLCNRKRPPSQAQYGGRSRSPNPDRGGPPASWQKWCNHKGRPLSRAPFAARKWPFRL